MAPFLYTIGQTRYPLQDLDPPGHTYVPAVSARSVLCMSSSHAELNMVLYMYFKFCVALNVDCFNECYDEPIVGHVLYLGSTCVCVLLIKY